MAAKDSNTTPRPFHNQMGDELLEESCPRAPTNEPLMNIAVYTHRLNESTRRQRSDAVGAPSTYDERHRNLDVHAATATEGHLVAGTDTERFEYPLAYPTSEDLRLPTPCAERNVNGGPSSVLINSQGFHSVDTPYGLYLAKRYRTQEQAALASSLTSFPSPTDKYFTLAMIKKEKYQRGRINDSIIRMSITGKVDDILLDKHHVEIKDILRTSTAKRKVILIEGAPGSGKSTLSLHICQEWGNSNLFAEYDIVILVQLRDPEIQKAKTISDLLPCRDDQMAHCAAAEITARDGKKVLWVLDGWDELPLSLQKSSLFWEMVNAPMTRRSPFLLSDIIVTSRPISSSQLQKVAASRFEILGFTLEQQEEYFKDCFKDAGTSDCQKFLEIVRSNPVLQSCCYLPQYAAYIVNLYLCEDNASLNTEYDIFSAVIVNCVHRHFDKNDQADLLEDVDSLDQLSTHEATMESFNALCELAYNGITENKVSFSPSDLPQKFSNLGLLQGVESFASRGKNIVFHHFLNLSIQELLAGFHIARKLPADDQSSKFQKLFDEPRFSAVFKFYAAITRLKSPGIDDVLIRVVQEMRVPKLISLLHCLHEAQNDDLCQRLAQELSGVLYLFVKPLNPLDSFAVGYLLSNICVSIRVHQGLISIDGEFRVDLDNCQMGDQGCKSLVKGVCMYLDRSRTIVSQAILELAGNTITAEGVSYIAELLSETGIISKLTLGHMLSGNPIGSRGLHLILDTLVTNKCLTELDLSNCVFEVTAENGPVLEKMLKCNRTLKSLLFRNAHINDNGVPYIANGLARNTAVTALRLYNCGFTSYGANCIGNALSVNKSLKLLNISHNGIGGSGAKSIAKGLRCNVCLITCVLDSCDIDDDGACSLADAVVVNTAIESLWLEDNLEITSKGVLALTDALSKNRSMEKLILPHHFTSKTERKLNDRRKLSGLPAIELRTSELSTQRMLVPPPN